jgi:hypothetical protein
MSRHPQPSDVSGSLRDIQILVNEHPNSFSKAIIKKLNVKSGKIEWLSPLKEDGYAEYSDSGFINRLGINSLKINLDKFWPKNGPQWDALGKGDKREIFLVESNADIPEIVTQGLEARNTKPVRVIKKSLETAKSYLEIKNKTDWSGTFYQYTNRLAHLYYLRILNRIPAYLVLVYFIGDETVSGPKTIEEWKAAITVMKKHLGVGKHKLSKYIAEIYIQV